MIGFLGNGEIAAQTAAEGKYIGQNAGAPQPLHSICKDCPGSIADDIRRAVEFPRVRSGAFHRSSSSFHG